MDSKQKTAVVTPKHGDQHFAHRWQPIQGTETRRLVDRKRLPVETGTSIVEAASSILSRGTDPFQPNICQTGLVVGYVQSGKTLSFTTVMALARDNGYRLVVVVAGTSKPLHNQSTQRLRDDLYVADVDGSFRWTTFENPDDAENNKRAIEQVLDEWRDPNVPNGEKPTVLITVMKNHIHLRNLVALLNKLELEGVPTLIIDDEADQASLNTLVKQGRSSTTYSRVLELRDAVPSHTFLQYTATPQAPLLINIIDSLSPDYVEVLDPGEDYIGGAEFFRDVPGLVQPIPEDEVPTDDNPLIDPPESLLDALRIFFVGVAVGLIQGRDRNNINRSMLVHPSRKTVHHHEYNVWIGRIFDEWRNLVNLPEGDLDRKDFIQDFQQAYVDLAQTVPDLPPLNAVVEMLPRAFRLTTIEEVNTRRGRGTPIIDWSRSYGWILVGGQAMDRGFTVEGLTVTYMPRGPGVGNADTIQQRGRFFGYKRPYLGYCRIYLEQDVLAAFKEYVEHEEDMRSQLQDVRNENTPLDEWKRKFVLSPDLKPCRNNVIQFKYARGELADKWFNPKVVLCAESVMRDNRKVIEDFFDGLHFAPDEGSSDRELVQMHDVCQGLSLRDVVTDLLVPYRITAPSDSHEITGVLLQLSHALEENEDERCTVYRMSPGYPRQRAVDSDGKIRQLFQGEYPVNPPEHRGSVYPGDRSIRQPKDVTIQVHKVNLMRDGDRVAEDVPIIAIWIPRRMKLSWLVQEQS